MHKGQDPLGISAELSICGLEGGAPHLPTLGCTYSSKAPSNRFWLIGKSLVKVGVQNPKTRPPTESRGKFLHLLCKAEVMLSTSWSCIKMNVGIVFKIPHPLPALVDRPQ